MSVTLDRQRTPWEVHPGWGISVDLTPREVLQARQVRVHKRLIALGLVVVLLALAGLSLMALDSKRSAQDSYDQSQARTADLVTATHKYDDVTTMTEVLGATRAQAQALLADDVDYVNLVARIRAALPPGVTIANLAVILSPSDTPDGTTTPATGPVVIGSVTIAGNGPKIKDLAPFVASLNSLKGITEVVPTSSSQATSTGTMAYTLTLNITSALFTHRFDVVGAQ